MITNEVSPDTLEGSFTRDLVLSKLWLIKELKKIKKNYDVVYILGSWFGNLSLILINKHMDFDKIINVEINKKVLKTGKQLAKKIGVEDKIEDMHKDANKLDYRQATDNSVIINTSTTNMKNKGWFDHIPKNTLVALQGRNNDPGAVNNYNSLDEFVNSYQFRKILFKGKLSLDDPETSYNRYMVIGIK
jgi:hypothetical protein